MGRPNATRRPGGGVSAGCSGQISIAGYSTRAGQVYERVSRFGRAALGYGTALRWPVFPVKAHAKAPPLIAAWPDNASTDPTTIIEWWRRWPNANIGLHCTGPIVLDIDDRRGGRASLDALITSNGPLPPTAVSRSPNGLHLFFRCHARVGNSAGQLGMGLDVRSSGGYAILPPSTRPEGIYRWLRRPDAVEVADAPAWLVRLLVPPKPTPRPATPPLAEPSDRLLAFALRRDIEAVRTAPPGQRNHTLYCKARALARFAISRAELRRDLVAAAMTAGLDAAEAAATVSSAFRSRDMA